MVIAVDKYLCLAEYRCQCGLGKAVSRTTMDRHRESANQRREAMRLSTLTRGQMYSQQAVDEQYQSFLSMPINEVADLSHPGGASEAAPATVDVSDDGVPMVMESGEDNTESTPMQSLYPDSVPQSTFGLQPNDDLSSSAPSDQGSCMNVDGSNESGSMQDYGDATSLDDQLTVTEAQTESINIGGELEAPTGTNMGGLQATAAERFHYWVSQEKEWLEMCFEKGVRLTVQGEIFRIIKAPFGVTQFRRNLAKYTDFDPVPYISCRKHMLLCAVDSPVADSVNNSPSSQNLACEVCEELGTSPELVTFESYPLESRIRAWVEHEESCMDLFEYHQAKISERAAAMADPNYTPVYEDFFDGKLYKRILDDCGGPEAVMFDIFIAPSTDGFQTFENRSYDCWPLVAVNHNLPPHKRYLIKNLIPLGFIKGPDEPTRLDTWFKPLKEEISRLNQNGGTEMLFFDGVVRKVRVHIIFQTGDGPSVNKQAGLVGFNGRSPCRYCELHGVWCSIHRHMYFPTRSDVFVPSAANPVAFKTAIGAGEKELRTFWYPEAPTYRTQASIESTLQQLDGNSILSEAAKSRLTTATGIKPRTIPLLIHSVFPYISFPPDTMHKWMNVCKDFMNLFKGQCVALRNVDVSGEGFVLSRADWRDIDSEMDSIKKGTSSSEFQDVTRNSSHFTSWKASECQEFLTNYALILFDGYLPIPHLKNLWTLSCIVDLCRRPSLLQEDVSTLTQLGVNFVREFEALYYRNDVRRVGVCKSTIHDIVHLGWMVEHCGPPVNYNLFWVERYVGYIKNRLHATYLAAESLGENAKAFERYKLYFDKHFVSKDGNDAISPQTTSDGESQQDVEVLPPWDYESLSSPYHVRKGTRRLLTDYIKKAEGLGLEEARMAVEEDNVVCYGRMRIKIGDDTQVVGASEARRHRAIMKRSDWYIAAEFYINQEEREIYYGRILKIIKYKFRLHSEVRTRTVLLANWANNLEVTAVEQVFRATTLDRVFTGTTVEDSTVVLKSIGVLEHRTRTSRRVRTFLIDPYRKSNRLLEPTARGVDGVNRTLGGLRSGRS